MASMGIIHMACYCGAELFYVGNTEAEVPQEDVIEQLRSKVGADDIGIFSSADGEYGECPYCGLSYELPDPELLDWLPYLDRDRFSSLLEDIKKSASKTSTKPHSSTPAHRYML